MTSPTMVASLSPRRRLSALGKSIFRGTDAFFAAQSRVSTAPVIDPSELPELGVLTHGFDVIAHELERVLVHRASFPPFATLSSAQRRIASDDRWRVFALRGFGHTSARNARWAPVTTALLERIGAFNAFLSVLEPGKHVPRHQGVTRGFIRGHLPIRVPGVGDCRMDVDGTMIRWTRGQLVLFDDSRPHEVWNDSDEPRAVLLFDVPRPMRAPGRMLLASLLFVLERTYYVREPLENQRRWEAATRDVFG